MVIITRGINCIHLCNVRTIELMFSTYIPQFFPQKDFQCYHSETCDNHQRYKFHSSDSKSMNPSKVRVLAPLDVAFLMIVQNIGNCFYNSTLWSSIITRNCSTTCRIKLVPHPHVCIYKFPRIAQTFWMRSLLQPCNFEQTRTTNCFELILYTNRTCKEKFRAERCKCFLQIRFPF